MSNNSPGRLLFSTIFAPINYFNRTFSIYKKWFLLTYLYLFFFCFIFLIQVFMRTFRTIGEQNCFCNWTAILLINFVEQLCNCSSRLMLLYFSSLFFHFLTPHKLLADGVASNGEINGDQTVLEVFYVSRHIYFYNSLLFSLQIFNSQFQSLFV